MGFLSKAQPSKQSEVLQSHCGASRPQTCGREAAGPLGAPMQVVGCWGLKASPHNTKPGFIPDVCPVALDSNEIKINILSPALKSQLDCSFRLPEPKGIHGVSCGPYCVCRGSGLNLCTWPCNLGVGEMDSLIVLCTRPGAADAPRLAGATGRRQR